MDIYKKFQLHHTGIKTIASTPTAKASADFNCTIQELKPSNSFCFASQMPLFQLHHTGIKTAGHYIIIWTCRHFNCTIQELKP